MPFRRINAGKLSDQVADQIELLILRGILRPGERLPSERELSDRLGVSRPSLREAIADLQSQGLLEARQGAGIFVSGDLNAVFPDALTRLFGRHPDAIADYVSFRRDMEGLAAERAALYGSETDLQLISAICARMQAAQDRPDPAHEADLDAEFHIAIIEASHNIIMLHMMRAMFGMLRDGVFYNRQAMFGQRAARESLLAQHLTIRDAILARDPKAARKAVETHLDFVWDRLHAQRKSEENEAIARQRLEHEKAR